MEQIEFFLCVLATVAKVDRAMGGIALAAVVVNIHRTVVD